MESTISFLAVVETPPPSFAPLYLTALMPAPEDSQDTIATDEEQKTSTAGEAPLIEGRLQVGESPTESMDTGPGSEGSPLTETYENPFLKPPKRVKLKLLSH